MQRLMEQSQRRPRYKPLWSAGNRPKLLVISILLASPITGATLSTGSPDNLSYVGKRNHSLLNSVDRLKGKLPLVQLKKAKSLQTDVPAARHKASSDAMAPLATALKDETRCLALNIYWEARNQSIAGQLAVAQVTMNRVLDPRYADNVCDVVYEHKQFSWYWDGKPDTPKEPRAWETARLIADAAMHGSRHVEFQGVTHYHAVYSEPFWKNHMVQIAMIGDHVFYAGWQ